MIMFDRDFIKNLDSIYEDAVQTISETDKIFDNSLTKLQFMWSAYEEHLNKTIDSHSNIEMLGYESLDKIRLSEFLRENGYFNKYPSNLSIHDQVKDKFNSLKDDGVRNLAEQTDIIKTLKRFVTSELEPDLKTRAIKIILAQKQMLNLSYTHFPDELK